MIQRSTRLQRLKAKHDVTYDRVKTGAEKDIQSMKEQITESQARMGDLTKERDALRNDLDIYKNENKTLKSDIAKLHSSMREYEIRIQQMKEQINNLEFTNGMDQLSVISQHRKELLNKQNKDNK